MPNNTVFSAQISPEHIALIKQQGFKTIINNRPDHEEPNQPLNADIEKVAKELGMPYHFQPVVASSISKKDCQDFADIFNNAEKPVFMFCRTGNRCNILFHHAEQLDLLD
ncbi:MULTISPECIES: TIGR01244 family sulfur transferase [unclassified Moraxella]|uniref:TIGR01244 family sulfur transferase n=1 Tax=unclassified Moraxella TaxID=2685852 RepID=UPI003AF8CCFA